MIEKCLESLESCWNFEILLEESWKFLMNQKFLVFLNLQKFQELLGNFRSHQVFVKVSVESSPVFLHFQKFLADFDGLLKSEVICDVILFSSFVVSPHCQATLDNQSLVDGSEFFLQILRQFLPVFLRRIFCLRSRKCF